MLDSLDIRMELVGHTILLLAVITTRGKSGCWMCCGSQETRWWNYSQIWQHQNGSSRSGRPGAAPFIEPSHWSREPKLWLGSPLSTAQLDGFRLRAEPVATLVPALSSVVQMAVTRPSLHSTVKWASLFPC